MKLQQLSLVCLHNNNEQETDLKHYAESFPLNDALKQERSSPQHFTRCPYSWASEAGTIYMYTK